MTLQAVCKLSRVVVFAIALTGCVLSIDPVVSESDATFDPRLLGSWEEVSGSGRAVVSLASETTYAIEYINGDGEVGKFEARLGKLAERLVLDVWPEPGETELPAPYAEMLVPGHLLFVLDVEGNEIRMAQLEPDSLLAAIRAGDVGLDHLRSQDRLILLGTTEGLRSGLSAHFARSGSFWSDSRGGV